MWDSLSQISHMLPGLSHCIPFHPSPSFSVSKFCLPVPPLGHILVKSSLSSGLKNPIWSSLCRLNPLPMAHSFLSHAKSTSPHHSSFFPRCVVCSTQCLHHIFLMPFWNDTVPLAGRSRIADAFEGFLESRAVRITVCFPAHVRRVCMALSGPSGRPKHVALPVGKSDSSGSAGRILTIFCVSLDAFAWSATPCVFIRMFGVPAWVLDQPPASTTSSFHPPPPSPSNTPIAVNETTGKHLLTTLFTAYRRRR